jgi:uncharacterized membrane protein YdbT with pleckstrin-like domain
MRIRPSFHGFFLKHYYLTTIIAIVSFGVGAMMMQDPMMGTVSLGAIGFGAALIVWGLVHAYANQRTTLLYINNEEVIYETGIMEHSKRVAPIHMITDSHVHRSFMERIMGIAGMRINTSGTAEFEIDIDDFNYKDINALHDRIYRLIRKAPPSLKGEETRGNIEESKK